MQLPAGIKTFVAGIFQDVDGSPSSKRTGFFVFIGLIVICTVGAVFWKVAVPQMIWDGLIDLVKWIGTAILGERAPALLAAFRGGVATVDREHDHHEDGNK